MAIEPTVFRWDEMEADSPIKLLSRKTIRGKQAMVAQIHLQKGCHINTHSHENEQIAVVLSGSVVFRLGADDDPEKTEVTLTGGDVLVLWSWLPHGVDVLEDAVILDIFSPPAEKMGVDSQKD